MNYDRYFRCGCGLLSLGLTVLTNVSAAEAPTQSQGTGSPWSVQASIGLEYDDNLNIQQLDVSTGQSDVATVIDASLGYASRWQEDYDIEAGYDFYQSLYQDYTNYNLQSHSLYLSAAREFSGLDLGLNYRYTRSLLDNDDFLQIHSLQPTLGYSVRPNWYLNLAYSYQDKKFYQAPARDGSQQALAMDNYIVFNGNKSYIRLGYRLEGEDTKGPEFDYLGHYFNAGMSTPFSLFSKEGKVDLSYQYYTKDYSNITASIGRKRRDHRHTLGAGVTTNLSKEVFANLKYEHIAARSNLPSADFNENILTLSVGRSW